MINLSVSRHVFLGLCFLLLFHGCLAQLSPLPKQQIDQITAREPNRVLVSEAGVSEFWDSFGDDELECAGVEAVRHTINPKGLLLPYYPSAPELVYVVRGKGLQGTVLPGCPETFETSFESESGRERFFDKHQRVYRYKEGDILALPAGTVRWTYNDGDTPIVTIVLRDISNVANQLDSNFRKFFLAGNPQSMQLQQGSRVRGHKGSSGSQGSSWQPGTQPWSKRPSEQPWSTQPGSWQPDTQPWSKRPSEQPWSRQPGSWQPDTQPWSKRPSEQPWSTQPGTGSKRSSEQPWSTQPGTGSRRPSEQPWSTQPGTGSRRPSEQPWSTQPGTGSRRPSEQPWSTQPGTGSKRTSEQPWSTQPGTGSKRPSKEQGQQGYNIFSGFDDIILEEIFKVESDTIRKLQGVNDDRGLIVKAENLQVLVPEEQEQQKSSQGGRSGSGRANGVEQTLCSTQLSANIASPVRADMYNPRGGRISNLNSHKLPVLNALQLSAERGVLYKNAVLAPHYNLNAHSIIYVTSGSSRLQIVNNNGKPVFDDIVREGQLIVVPQDFAVIKKAGDEGCEWVAFKTNDNAITTQLAGRFSFIRALPEDVLLNSYDISREQAKSLKYSRQEGVILSPRSESATKMAKNALLTALFG